MKQLFFSLIFWVVLPGNGLGQVAADTLAVTKQVDSLIQVSRGLTDKKDFEKALEINEAAEKLALEKLGRETAVYGRCCFNHGRMLYFKGTLPESEKWYLQAKAVQEKVLGNMHADYANSISGLALVYGRMGSYDKAEPLFLENLAIIERTDGKENSTYAQGLSSLAVLYRRTGKHEKAERLYLEAIAIFEKTSGKEHPQYVRTLNNLAVIYVEMGKYEKAESISLEGISITEKTVGKEHSNYFISLNNLAHLYLSIGFYEKAEPLLLEVNATLIKTLGKEHPDYVVSLNSLAILYSRIGNYEKAELNYLEAKAIREKLGKEHSDYANILNSLGHLYRDMGNFKRAEPLFIDALSIREKKLGKDHPDYATSLSGLRIVYQAMGNHEKAELFELEALAIREKAFGKEHLSYVASLCNLAAIYESMGKHQQAESLLLQAKSICEKTQRYESLIYSESLNLLASLYFNTGVYNKAESLFIEALANREKVIGKDHLNSIKSLSALARLYAVIGKNERSGECYGEVADRMKMLITKASHHLSERELDDFLRSLSNNQAQALSLAQNFSAATPTTYDNTLFYKGFLLNASNQVKRLALTDSTTAEKFNFLKSYERRLAAEYAKPISEQKNVPELEEKANNLEKDLARSVAGYGEAMQQVKWQEVQQNLKPGEAAIEFVHYQRHYKKQTDSIMYAALILRPLPAGAPAEAGDWAQPSMVHLFEQRQIKPLLAAANTAVTVGQLYATRGSKKSKNKTRGEKEEGIVIPGEKTANLYQLIWAPLDSLLRGVSTVYFAPSGLLHRLDLAAIAVPGTDQILADKYDLVQLGSTRQLVVREQPITSAQTATLFGGIKYDLEKPAETPDSVTQTKPSYDVAALRSALGGRGSDTWNYLPGTEKEVKNAAKTLGKAGYTVHALSGSEGSEAAFKMMGKAGNPAPRVLHIATHGFFFPDPKDTTQQRGAFSDREPVFKTSDNPLLRSGLVLAGANPAWAGAKTPEGQEDGILTAYEISQMNLSGTELVVLSACETGLGDVEDNEGVYGLKRSFKIAGAKYLIMSLWQVPDQQTQELMSAFYKNWLEDKMAIPKAFAAAQQTMRKRYEDPFFWAAFVLVE